MKKLFSLIRDNHDSIFKAFLFFITLILIVYFFPRKINFEHEYSKGKPWMQESIITSFDFSILKSEEQLLKRAMDSLLAKGGEVKKYMGGGSVHKKKNKMLTTKGWGASRKT